MSEKQSAGNKPAPAAKAATPKKEKAAKVPKPAAEKPSGKVKIKVLRPLWGAYNMPHAPNQETEVAKELADEMEASGHAKIL